MSSQPNPEKPVMLILSLSPTDCIPTAMAIQAHMPDAVLILKTRFTKEAHLKVSEHETRLASWLEGPEQLISSFDDLNDPFPVPITKPQGFNSRVQSLDASWLSCHVDDIFSIIEKKCEEWQGEVRVDILPGAKDPLIPLLLGNRSHPYSLWYTLEDGKAVNLGSGKNGDVIEGRHLSIVDRAWLSGYPVHVEEESSDPPTPDSLKMYMDICASLHPEILSPGRKATDLFDPAISIVPAEFSTRLEELGYRVEKRLKDGISQSSGEFLAISKGGVACELQVAYPPEFDATGKPGFWLEPIVHSLLWEHWDPVSAAKTVSLIEPTAELRLASFERLWRRGFDNYNSDHFKSKPAIDYLAECDRLSLHKDCSFSDFTQSAIDSMKSAGRSIDEKLRFIRITETDSILLDRFGVSTFDSKVKLTQATRRSLPLQKAMQLAKWIKGGQHIVISSSSPPLDAGDFSSIIHLQRMQDGRGSLLDEEGFLPKPLPEILIETREMNWSKDDFQSFELDSGVKIEFVPPSRITPLDGSKGPDTGLVVCDNSVHANVFLLMKKYGYIPEEIQHAVKRKHKDIGFQARGISREIGLKVMTSKFLDHTIYFSTVILDSERYAMSFESLSRLIEQNILLQSPEKSEILFLETGEDHEPLDILDAFNKITEEE